MSGASPAANALPVANFARRMMWDGQTGVVLDGNYDGKVDSADAAANPASKAVLALANKKAMQFKDVQAFVAKYDVSNRVGLPRPDGLLDESELRLMFVSLQQQIEFMNPKLSTPIPKIAASLLAQVDQGQGGNRNGKIDAADRNGLAPLLVRLAKSKGVAGPLDAAGIGRLLTKYDEFDAAHKRKGADGKLGPMEIGAVEDDLAALQPRPLRSKQVRGAWENAVHRAGGKTNSLA